MLKIKSVMSVFVAVFCLTTVLTLSAEATESTRLNRILENKVLRVGTPGDYRPFSMLDKTTGKYEGHDIDIVQLLATDLGVTVEYVPTTWPKLMDDYLADNFDVAVGGITRNLARMLKAGFLPPYAPNGKVALIRKADKDKFSSLEKIDVPETTIIVNPGGTNEKFVQANIKKAKVIIHPSNAEIPAMIAEGKGDVMITETYEAVVYSKKDERLYPAFTDKPLTKKSFIGFMIQQDDPQFTKIMNFLWIDAKLRGDLDVLFDKWLK
jgi:cyclohexadienyl dehydratase